MTAEALFSVLNLVAVGGWLLLIVAGRRRPVSTLVAGAIVPLLLAVVYTSLIITRWAASEGGFDSLGSVRTLFADNWLLLAGWVHYLAFDLFIGSWEVRDARDNGIPHLAVIPSLILTFLFGPIGLLTYAATRMYRTRSLAVEHGGHPTRTAT